MKVLVESKKRTKTSSITIKTLKGLGFKCSQLKHPNANGPDLIATKNGYPYRVEIKKARRLPSGSFQVPHVEENRKYDDLIAIELSDKYVLIEPMRDHLKCCSRKGFRVLTELA